MCSLLGYKIPVSTILKIKWNCSHFYFQITGHYGTPYLGSLKLCDGADLIHGWRFPRNYHMECIDLNDCYNEFLGISTS